MKKSKTSIETVQTKLVILLIVVLLAFIGLSVKLVAINRDNGERYKKQVLSQQSYDSTVIPYKRGEILDSKGTKLAVSEKVYNVILDTKILLSDEKYMEPTLEVLRTHLRINEGEIRSYIAQNPASQYYILAKKQKYDDVAELMAIIDDKETYPDIRGIWFEDEYIRSYPGNTMACDIIGFTTADGQGKYGLEEYYQNELIGSNGREYGYLNDDSTLERTTISATDGNNIVTTIDANVQSIVEKHLKRFNEENKDAAREGNGSNNTGCIIMDVDTGEILAMANYPVYDLNDTRNTDYLIGKQWLDEKGNGMGQTITPEIIDGMSDEEMFINLDSLWKNFCISDTYEPGSVIKPFTVAAGIESGSITGNETYNCEGKLHVGDYDIKCHNRYGDGLLTISEAVERSCNVAMMYISMAIGRDDFIKYQHIFNFGLKTNIDLSGEARTASLVYTRENIGLTEMATNSFGQGFNVTMIQAITGFCSLINGGYYYEPHVVKKIVNSDGATIKNVEPRLLKQTISASTSEKIRDYCLQVVIGENGTGKTARPAGYLIGGKTGTAETLPRGNNEYVVSFMGYAPADDPQIAIYVVVDRPNAYYQDDAKYATRIVRSILTEALPYLNIFMTEELSDAERAELEALQIEINQIEDEEEENLEELEEEVVEEIPEKEEIWRTFEIDPATGYAIDPNTGELVDPRTGASINGGSNLENTGKSDDPDAIEDTNPRRSNLPIANNPNVSDKNPN